MLVPPDFLTATAATYYTVPASKTVQIDQASVFNSDASARTVTIYLVPSGGTASAENAIVTALSLAAGETKLVPELNHKLTEAMTIQALASSANVVALTVSGSINS